MSKVLVLNSGSSSLKFKLFNEAAQNLTAVVRGSCQRIGEEQSQLFASTKQEDGSSRSDSFQVEIGDHAAALKNILHYLGQSHSRNIEREVKAVGHRVVHGKDIDSARVVTPDIEAVIEDAAEFAPLHNPANLQGIRAAAEVFHACPQVAVFDTAFHQTMPPEAFMYALPWELYAQQGIRRYGAHGTSYRYLVERAATVLSRPASELNLIIAHVGAGASMAAIANGRSLDTSMGLTPLEGLMMGTRCGDLDPAVAVHLGKQGLSPENIDQLLNKRSGFLGLAGANDLRTVLDSASRGEERASVALQVFVHRIRKYLGAYLVHLKGQCDAIVWSAGIGENSAPIRSHAMADLQAFGIQLDSAANDACVGREGTISSANSAVKVLVIPTDEELSIAQQSLEAIKQERDLAH